MREQRQGGFTLIESLLYCVILLVVVFIFAIQISMLLSIPTTKEVVKDVAWEVASYDVNKLLNGDLLEVKINSSNSLLVKTDDPTQVHYIFLNNSQIYKQKNSGFERIYSPIVVGSWHKVADNKVKLKITQVNGRIKERTYYVPKVVQ